jgi:hypothetical protein
MMEGYALITLDSTFSDVSPESSAVSRIHCNNNGFLFCY